MTGRGLGGMTNVTRQVIVSDITLLKAKRTHYSYKSRVHLFGCEDDKNWRRNKIIKQC
ncbi:MULTISPECIES: hypothetical protein [Viridibacillus]|uniref:hypothetical protein n=1 Tax=Viridibacillus TaxID=496496 RepID=UPI001F2CFCA5|nr:MULTISPECIES: hypothetical protein [Viridibacillus]